MKIYTRTGDDGTTMLFSGGRVPKAHLRVEAYGTVDELNAQLGVVRTGHLHGRETAAWLVTVQRQLFTLGADLATPLENAPDWIVRLDAVSIAWLEETIDHMTSSMPELKAFILPGGTAASASIHVARTICRRAERISTVLAAHEAIADPVIPYLNRLSDWLFTLARWENHCAGVAEEEWSGR
jgi:cob(I)alamin adenosyltransferase